MSKQDHKIGSSKKNLILKTAGSIKVLVGDKYYNLSFSKDNDDIENESEEEVDLDDNDSSEDSNDDIIIINSINNYDYPGDGKVVLTLDGNMFYTSNGSFKNYLNSTNNNSNDIFNSTVKFNNAIPFKLNSKILINNLNSEYLNGYNSSDFIHNSDTINIKNLIVKNIETDDKGFFYKNGELSINPFIPSLNFINNKVIIGNGINIIKSEELRYSKILPHENNLLQDFLEIAMIFCEDSGNSLYYYFTNMFNYDKKLDISKVDNYSNSEQFDFFSRLNNIIISKKESTLWDSELILHGEMYSFRSIYDNVVNISDLPYMKSSYILYVDNTDNLSIYDQFKINITEYNRLKQNGDSINICYSDDSYSNSLLVEVNCIITKIDRVNNKISITTDYESEIYKKSLPIEIEFKYDDIYYKYDLYDSALEDCTTSEIISGHAYSGHNIIGDISGEFIDDYGELNGYGLLMRDNSYLLNSHIESSFIKKTELIKSNIDESELTNSLILNSDINDSYCKNLNINYSKLQKSNLDNCRIINNINYVELDYSSTNKIDYYINLDQALEYSILSNDNNIILPNSSINGLVISIFFIDNSRFSVNDVYTDIGSETYNIYRNIPISKDVYKWIKIN